MTIALKAPNGRFVTAENGGDSTVVATRTYTELSELGDWEKFTVAALDGQHVAIVSSKQRLWSAEEGGGHDLSCNRTFVGPWEMFKLVKGNALQCFDKIHYVGIDEAGLLHCKATEPTAFLPIALEAAALSQIHVDGLEFRTEHNHQHIIKGHTDLMLAWRYDLEGPEVAAEVMAERAGFGFNNLRVLWQKDIGNTGNSGWKMPLDKLAPFLQLADAHGLYIQGTILADCQVINPTFAEQQQRVDALRYATHGIKNLIEQLGNEYDKNGHDPTLFGKPSDRLAANSSSTEGGHDAPYWDFFCFSGQRSPLNHAVREYGPLEFMYGNGAWGGVPAICDEGFKPGINSSNPRDYERAGAQARSGCGGRLHTDAGTAGNSRAFNDIERECAAAFIQGIG